MRKGSMTVKKRLTALLLTVLLLCVAVSTPLSASAAYTLDEATTVNATEAYVVFLGNDPSKDDVLFEKNANEKIAPAGLVRIMVGLQAMKLLESKKLDPATATASFTEEIDKATHKRLDGTGLVSVGLAVGDVWKIEDVLDAVMINTAGDAVTLLCVALAGSHEAFVDAMNATAAELGCVNTHFENAYGLEHEAQYTCASDMYRILRHASFYYPALAAVMAQTDCTINPVVGGQKFFANTCELLRYYSGYYDKYVRFGRSGRTEATGQSCASVAQINGLNVMAVTLGSRDDVGDNCAAFRDTTALYKWVKNTFDYKTVIHKSQPLGRADVYLGQKTDSVPLVAATDFVVMLRKEIDINTIKYTIELNPQYLDENGKLTAPVNTQTQYAVAHIYDGDVLLGSIPLYAQTEVKRSQLLAIATTVWSVLSSPFVLIALGVLFLLCVIYVIIAVVHNRSRRKKKQRRVKRYR